jgi:hypothetical protein
MVYDWTRGLCVLVGGQDQAGPMSDTWTFDGTAWTEQPTTTQTVRDHSFAFLQTTNQAVRFGGFVAAPNTLTNQTWELGSGIFGSGCAGTSGVPALAATTAPLLGQPWTVELDNLNPMFNFGFLVLGLTQAPGIDLSLIGMPGCAGFTTPDLLVDVIGAGGSATWTWPAVTGPIGASLFGQALCLDPTANAFGFTVSNAVYATITN